MDKAKTYYGYIAGVSYGSKNSAVRRCVVRIAFGDEMGTDVEVYIPRSLSYAGLPIQFDNRTNLKPNSKGATPSSGHKPYIMDSSLYADVIATWAAQPPTDEFTKAVHGSIDRNGAIQANGLTGPLSLGALCQQAQTSYSPLADRLIAAPLLHSFILSETGHNLSANKLIQQCHGFPLKQLIQDPYVFRYTPDIRFDVLDKLAAELGVMRNDPRRRQAALYTALSEMRSNGSTILSPREVNNITSTLLNEDANITTQEIVRVAGDRFATMPELGDEENVIDLEYVKHEGRIAGHIIRMLNEPGRAPVSFEDAFNYSFSLSGFHSRQRAAVALALSSPVALINGGPGRGKSFLIDGIVQGHNELAKRPLYLAAPTGKAAVRMTEATGIQARTVHSLFRLNVGGGNGNQSDALASDVSRAPCTVLIDEFTLADVAMADNILARLHPKSSIIFVGDPDQLSPVGPGAVFRDLLDAGEGKIQSIPQIVLTKDFRTSPESADLRKGATMIRNGILPNFEAMSAGVSAYRSMPSSINFKALDLYRELRKVHSPDQIAIVTPMENYEGGHGEINSLFSNTLNKGAPGFKANPRGQLFRVGDRVIFTANESNLINGDSGTIVDYKADRNLVSVMFDRGFVEHFDKKDMRKFVPAFALTAHKAQGSQFSQVIIPFNSMHQRIQSRALLYTTWTRASERVHLVGDLDYAKEIIDRDLNSSRQTLLNTFLSSRLREDWVLRAPQKYRAFFEMGRFAQEEQIEAPTVSVEAEEILDMVSSASASEGSAPDGLRLVWSRLEGRDGMLFDFFDLQDTAPKAEASSVQTPASGWRPAYAPASINSSSAASTAENDVFEQESLLAGF